MDVKERLTDTTRHSNYSPKGPIPVIEIKGLKKIYGEKDERVVALDGVDLTIHKGEIFGIIGMSGAGKSTLIRCINRLDTPTEGSIFMDGQDIIKLDTKGLSDVRKSVGMIFQQFNLLEQRNVERNVRFPLDITGVTRDKSKERVKQLLDRVGLSEKAKAYPSQLSGGQKQRVAIARALASNPKVLLSDEATSALDPMTTRSILSLLESINRELGITIVIITHEMEVIRQICTHVAIIDEGRIAESGSVEEVFTHPKTAAARRLFRSMPVEASLQGKRCIRIVFEGETAHDPVVANMVLACGEPINILCGDIRHLGKKAYGQLVVELPEPSEAAHKALDYLKLIGLTWEEVKTDGMVDRDGTGPA